MNHSLWPPVSSSVNEGSGRLRTKVPSGPVNLRTHSRLTLCWGYGSLAQEKARSLPSRNCSARVMRKEGRNLLGICGAGGGKVRQGKNSSVPVTKPGLLGGGEGRGWGVCQSCCLDTGTYRDSEGRGPAVVQHGAIVGVLQGVLDGEGHWLHVVSSVLCGRRERGEDRGNICVIARTTERTSTSRSWEGSCLTSPERESVELSVRECTEVPRWVRSRRVLLLERALGSAYANPSACMFHHLLLVLQDWEPVSPTPRPLGSQAAPHPHTLFRPVTDTLTWHPNYLIVCQSSSL